MTGKEHTLKTKFVLISLATAVLSAAASAATTIYVRFKPYSGVKIEGVTMTGDGYILPPTQEEAGKAGWIAVSSFDTGLQQTLNIGSQTTGAGAGKVAFLPANFAMASSTLDPVFLRLCASGTPFERIDISVVNSTGTKGVKPEVSPLIYHLKLAALSNLSWVPGDSSVTCKFSVDYGAIVVESRQTLPNGTLGEAVKQGWNRIKNTVDNDPSGPVK